MAKIPKETQVAFRVCLINWFITNQRTLPWRKNRTAYRVWISELMLQQTRVDQATPYYRRFMKRFPSLTSLANAEQQEVLKYWEGLGYYARARNLHAAAQEIKMNLRGRFPNNYHDLIKVKGIGPYTAAAVASFAFGEDVAVVDGNVYRVLSRVFAYDKEISLTESKQQFQLWVDELLPIGKSALFNEGMMELGATLCTPRKPHCETCPLTHVCKGKDRPYDFPHKKKKAPVPLVKVGAAVVENAKGEVLIAQRPQDKMLGGLWEFPGGKIQKKESMPECIARELKEELGVDIKVGKFLIKVKHTYSHFKLEMDVHWAKILRGLPDKVECADWAWCDIDTLDEYPFSKADLKVIDKLKSEERV